VNENAVAKITAVISREQLHEWLEAIARKATLIAPKQVAGVLLYQPVGDIGEIEWDYVRPQMSAKEFFFPPTEQLMTIKLQDTDVQVNEAVFDQPQVIFGIRACDARGVLALDAMFSGTEPVDPYFKRRYDQTIKIGLACQEVGPYCFCTSVGSGPKDASGMDIQLIEKDDEYILKVMTERGDKFIAESGIDLTYLSSRLVVDRQEFYPEPDRLRDETWPVHFKDNFWDEYSERCLSCRICAYVCPTCRCFDLRDEALPSNNGQSNYERVRCWDSCAGAVYRRAAGGHVQRSEKGERLRNRFYCKYYYYPKQYQAEACTGCGRCVELCPVGIDITEVLDYMGEVVP
jgi:sulfhydrogenase subunit beta (sulfur reductase)